MCTIYGVALKANEGRSLKPQAPRVLCCARSRTHLLVWSRQRRFSSSVGRIVLLDASTLNGCSSTDAATTSRLQRTSASRPKRTAKIVARYRRSPQRPVKQRPERSRSDVWQRRHRQPPSGLGLFAVARKSQESQPLSPGTAGPSTFHPWLSIVHG